ncbi:BAR domain [Popillia japonica]|uniref:BAR domain n=1 Tax=Popillia japonica TaxID=7064 RepID=A0AAW1JCG2_POPJA
MAVNMLHEYVKEAVSTRHIKYKKLKKLDNGYAQILQTLEDFRKKQIGGVKTGKKKFDKQTTKFCQCQERYLNLTVKKQNTVTLQEADASVDMAERHFYNASMEYVYLIQEVHERKKFEFVETLLSFMFSWLTFYHQGYEVAKDFQPYMFDLQCKIQKTRDNFEDYSCKLRKRMAEVQKQTQEEPLRNTKGKKEGYLFLLEKKAFGATWTKYYCTYDKETKKFTMLPYNQLTSKSLALQEELLLISCVRRMSDSIDKRFCFDLQVDSRPGIVYTFQALSETDRKSWMDIMDGKEPMYTSSGKPQNNEERVLDDVGINFVKRCIEVLESRGLEEQGIYRVVGVASKVTKLLNTGLDRRKNEKLTNLDDSQEWETKTITSALKSYLRNLPEPLMTYRYHNGFIAAVKNDSRQMRVNDVHALVYRIPKLNFDILKILVKHLTRVVSKSDKNLMTVSNLGVCFGPTLLRPEEETVASIMDLKFYNIVVEILIENYDKIFNSEPANNTSPEKLSPQSGNYTNNINHISSGGPVGNSVSLGHTGGHVSPIYITSDSPENNYNPIKTYPSNHINNSTRTYQPYTCSVRTYVEPTGPANISASLCNVHDPQTISMYYNMSRSERVPNNTHQTAHHRKMQKLGSSGISSQSESNIPGMQSCSPTNFRIYGKLEQNSASSSNESVSSNSRDSGNNIGYTSISPEKSKRSNIGMPYPKSYRAQGAVACDAVWKTNISTSATSSGRSSPSFTPVRRVRTLYACLGENDGELSFEPNQIITNVKQSQEPGWLEGTLNGKTGLIPENYVEMLP